MNRGGNIIPANVLFTEILLSLQKYGLPQQNELLKSSECLCIDADVVQSGKRIARLLGKVLGARVEIRRIEIPEKKPIIRKKPRRSQERRVK